MPNEDRNTLDAELESGVMVTVAFSETPGFVAICLDGDSYVITASDARRLSHALTHAAAFAEGQ
jgi:hypothetical protein